MVGAVSSYDVFVSHAGASKPFAAQLARRLGGDKGDEEASLRLRTFLDRTSLKPGDDADKVMMTSVEAQVGIVVLDEVYLTKEWPVKELRRIMELLTNGQVRVLPVMYSTTYSALSDTMKRLSDTDSSASKGASRDDAAMLQKLERITMVHSNNDDVDAFLETISFAVLRHLVGACRRFETLLSREHETIFVSNVLNAVRYVCDDQNFRSISRRDVVEAKEWLADLDCLYRQMHRVRVDVNRRSNLAADVCSHASSAGMAEVPKVAAHLQRNAVVDAGSSNLSTDLNGSPGKVAAAQTSQAPQPPPLRSGSTEPTSGAADEDEFLDPITYDVIVDPVIGSNGSTYDRFTAYQLMTHGSVMPGCDEPFRICADNVHFRGRLRRAHPETEDAMRRQRQDCLERAQTAFAANEYGTARYWFELIRTWSPESAAAPLAACEAYCAAEVSTDRADACETLPTTSLLPSVGSEQIAASPELDSSRAVEQGQTALALLERASNKSISGDSQGAVSDCDAALVLDPRDATALVMRGDAKRLLGDHEGAVRDCDEALVLEPRSAFALMYRGAAKHRLGDYKGAISDCDEALVLEPRSAYALSVRGAVKYELGDYKGAVSDFDEALVLGPLNAAALRTRDQAKRSLGEGKTCVVQ